MMTPYDPYELEIQLQALLSGDLEETHRTALLERIVRKDDVREQLEDMLRLQETAREAFGYDLVSVPDVKAVQAGASSKVNVQSPTPADQAPAATTAHWPAYRIRWVWRIAAMFLVAVSVWLALSARQSNRRVRDELAALRDSLNPPSSPLTETDLARYRTAWREVTQASGEENTWILLSNGGGQFGSIGRNAPSRSTNGTILLIRYRILDSQGRCRYAVDLLAPDRPEEEIRLPDAGRIAGQVTALRIQAENDLATVGVSVGTDQSAGVIGQTAIDAHHREMGRFHVDGEDLRLFVQATRLPGLSL